MPGRELLHLAALGKKALHLRSKPNRAVSGPPNVHRGNTDGVAGGVDLVVFLIHDAEGKVAVEVLGNVDAVL